MAKLQMKSGFTCKLKLLLTLAQLLILSTFTDIRIPLTHLEYRFERIDVSFFLRSASKFVTINSFNTGRALERIGQSDFEKMYRVMAFSAIKQAGIPTERLALYGLSTCCKSPPCHVYCIQEHTKTRGRRTHGW